MFNRCLFSCLFFITMFSLKLSAILYTPPSENTGFFDLSSIHEPTEEQIWFFERKLPELQKKIEKEYRCDPKLILDVPKEIDDWFFNINK